MQIIPDDSNLINKNQDAKLTRSLRGAMAARSAVNRKVAGSSPAGGGIPFTLFLPFFKVFMFSYTVFYVFLHSILCFPKDFVQFRSHKV
jgi:hypothetical protein